MHSTEAEIGNTSIMAAIREIAFLFGCFTEIPALRFMPITLHSIFKNLNIAETFVFPGSVGVPACNKEHRLQNRNVFHDTLDDRSMDLLMPARTLVVPGNIQTAWPAAKAEAHAHWKLNPPSCPVTSITSPMKNSPGVFLACIVFDDSS